MCVCVYVPVYESVCVCFWVYESEWMKECARVFVFVYVNTYLHKLSNLGGILHQINFEYIWFKFRILCIQDWLPNES